MPLHLFDRCNYKLLCRLRSKENLIQFNNPVKQHAFSTPCAAFLCRGTLLWGVEEKKNGGDENVCQKKWRANNRCEMMQCEVVRWWKLSHFLSFPSSYIHHSQRKFYVYHLRKVALSTDVKNKMSAACDPNGRQTTVKPLAAGSSVSQHPLCWYLILNWHLTPKPSSNPRWEDWVGRGSLTLGPSIVLTVRYFTQPDSDSSSLRGGGGGGEYVLYFWRCHLQTGASEASASCVPVSLTASDSLLISQSTVS